VDKKHTLTTYGTCDVISMNLTSCKNKKCFRAVQFFPKQAWKRNVPDDLFWVKDTNG
jgi:hypothetical protein